MPKQELSERDEQNRQDKEFTDEQYEAYHAHKEPQLNPITIELTQEELAQAIAERLTMCHAFVGSVKVNWTINTSDLGVSISATVKGFIK